jgi:hypothetical protein
MGRAAQDGAFDQFQNKILALPVTCDGLAVSLVALRGDTVTFGWTGPFTINGAEQALRGFSHYESPHGTCDLGATGMDIQHGEWTLRLDLNMSED